jgi:hypothetical protein
MKLRTVKSRPVAVLSEKKRDSPLIDSDVNKYKTTQFVIIPSNRGAWPEGMHPLFRPREDIKWDLHKDGVTYSLLSTFLQCPQKLIYQYGKRLSGTRVSGALAFGSVFHEALDIIYTRKKNGGEYGNVGEVLEWMENRDARKLQKSLSSPVAIMDLQENYGMVEIVLEAYMKRWEKEHNALGEWIALEEKFNTPYRPYINLGLDIPDVPLRGKRDGVFLCGDVPWLFETKTKAIIEADSIVDTMGFNLQNHLYMYTGAIDHGKQFGGVLYNLVRRPQLRKGATETLKSFLQRCRDDIAKRPDFYFMRYNFTSNSMERRQWLKDFNSIMWRLIMWYYNQYHYRDEGACSGRKGVCEFLALCAGRETNHIERPSIFPELEEGADE